MVDSRGWHGAEGPFDIVDAEGEPVAINTRPKRCWGLVYCKGRLNPGKAHRCMNMARAGRLTCASHRRHEAAAQRLKSENNL